MIFRCAKYDLSSAVVYFQLVSRVTLNSIYNPSIVTSISIRCNYIRHPINNYRVYSREQLLNNVWGTNVYVEDRTVDVHIRRLRKAITGCGHEEFIQTVRGSGYRFSGKLKKSA